MPLNSKQKRNPCKTGNAPDDARDRQLAELIDAWDALPDAIKATITTIVGANTKAVRRKAA